MTLQLTEKIYLIDLILLKINDINLCFDILIFKIKSLDYLIFKSKILLTLS